MYVTELLSEKTEKLCFLNYTYGCFSCRLKIYGQVFQARKYYFRQTREEFTLSLMFISLFKMLNKY